MDAKAKEIRDKICKLLNIKDDLTDEELVKKVTEAAKSVKNKKALQKVLLLLDQYINQAAK